MVCRPPRRLRAGAGALCALTALAGVLATGCNSGRPAQRDLYIRELRLQEDEIYRLEDYLGEYQAIVRGLRRENAKLREELEAKAPSPTPKSEGEHAEEGDQEHSLLDSPDWSPDRPSTPPDPPPAGEPSTGDETPPEVELPEIDAGEPTEAPRFEEPADARPSAEPAGDAIEPPLPETIEPPLGEPLPPESPSLEPLPVEPLPVEPGEAPPFDPPGTEDAGPLSSTAPAPLALPPPPATFPPVVDATLLSRHGSPEPSGEATLVAEVRPLSPEGSVTLFLGEASLLLRDPQQTGAAAELARWDFSPEEVALAWTDLETQPVLGFPLVLPDSVPQDRPLQLWVRLVDEQGQRAITDTKLMLGPPAGFAEPADAAPLPDGWRRASTDGSTDTEVRVAGFDDELSDR